MDGCLCGIPDLKSSGGWESVSIDECGEKLVSLRSLAHGRIIVEPRYHMDGIESAIDDCIVREGVAERLVRASMMLPGNHGLIVLDGWRPIRVQDRLFSSHYEDNRSAFPDLGHSSLVEMTGKFVSKPSTDPLRPSPHLTGGAVDLTICDGNGAQLPMGTEFDHFGEEAFTGFYEEKHVQGTLEKDESSYMANRRLLYSVMRSAGFSNYCCEWWHYDFGNQFWGKVSGREAVYGIADIADIADIESNRG